MKPLLIFSVFLIAIHFNLITCDRVEILIPKGSIVGEKYPLNNDGRLVRRFLGIPYARPPVGPLRFRRPVAIEKYNQTIDATKWPNSCYQQPEFLHRYHNKQFVEDCLYLNIWTPDMNQINTDNDQSNLKPVLVFIHGGGFIYGGTSDDLINMEYLSIKSDSISISLNYRIGMFGFLYADRAQSDVKGNQGLWDQALALQWINENVRYFGGDPNSITLIGHSAGSVSVSLHMLSPISRNLFQQAILMSGAAFGPYFVGESDEVLRKTLELVRAVDCANDDDQSINEAMIECMQQIPIENKEKMVKFEFFRVQPIIVVDGEFLPANPEKMLKDGNHKKNFNLLMNTVEDEGSFIFVRFNQSFSSEKLLLNDAKHLLEQMIRLLLSNKYSYDPNTFEQLYLKQFNENYDSDDLFKKQIGIAFGDLLLSCPTLNFVQKLFENDPTNINVYQWFYTAKLGRVKDLCSKWGGTCHSNELYPLFGKPFGNDSKLYMNREKEISNELIDIIRSFIRTGKPGEMHQEWQRYFQIPSKSMATADDGGGKVTIRPYYELSNDYKTFRSFKFNLKQLECEHLWN